MTHAAASTTVRVNASTSGDQFQSAVVQLAGGGYFVIWINNTLSLCGQRYDASGTKVDGELTLNTGGTYLSYPRITADANGGYAITWVGQNQDGSGDGIFAATFNSSGTRTGGPFQVAQTTADHQNDPSITTLANGNIAISWQQHHSGTDTWTVHFRIFNSTGTALTNEIQADTHHRNNFMPEIFTLADGSFIVAWAGYTDDTTTYDVTGQRFHADGTAYGSEFRMSSGALGEVLPAFTALADGSFVAVWQADGVYGQHFNADGTAAGTVTHHEKGGDAQVAALAGGGWVVIWEVLGQDAGWSYYRKVYGQVYDADGNTVGGEFHVGDGNIPTLPDVAANGNGFVVTWNSGYDIYQRTYVIDATNGAPELTDNHAELTTAVNRPLVVSTAQLLTGYTDGDGDALSTSGLTINHGTVHDNGDGTWTLTPTAGYAGAMTLGYTVSDGHGHDVAATINYTVATLGIATATRVNTSPDYNMTPVLTRLSDGGYVVAWASGWAQLDILLHRYNADGTSAGDVARINIYTSDNQSSPDIAAMADGGYIVVWESAGEDGNGSGVFYRRFDSSNHALDAADVQVNTTTNADQIRPHIAVLENGNYVVTWMSPFQASNSWDVYSRLYASDGTALSGETLVNTYTDELQDHPSVTAMSDGGYIIAWNGNGSSGSSADIWFQRYNASGDKVGSDTRANTTVYSYQYSPAITELADGGFVITWYGRNPGSYDEIRMQRFNASGAAVGSETRVDSNSIASDSPTAPKVAGLVDGGWVVVWQTTGYVEPDPYPMGPPPEGPTYAYAQMYGADGVAVGSPINVGTGRGASPSVVATETGFTVTWVSRLYGNRDIYQQSFVIAGADPAAGDTTYTVSDSNFVITEGVNQGTDTVRASVSYTLPANVEILVLTGAGDINGTGNGLANTITGSSGNNQLDGTAGADTLSGGLGNDTYVVDNASDLVVEAAGEGADIVLSGLANYTLTTNVESLTYSGSATFSGTGNDGANLITGAAGADTLSGGLGADTLNGGAGDDSLTGGTGSDSYIVDSTTDLIVELSGEGTDTVSANVGYTLSSNVENLVLTGSASVNSTGNELANTLTGNSGNNLLSGAAGNDILIGGGGTDTLVGGAGDDQYTVDSTDDVVTEVTGEGTDKVNASVTWTLVGEIEKLTLTGADPISGTGNELANSITGNTGNNLLSGAAGNDTLVGGGGTDTLVGGNGDDQYTVDSIEDVVTEANGEGTDTVNASVSWTLVGEIEKLTLTGADPINGTGNELANTITGNSGANTLSGLLGNDTFYGGAGADTMIGGAGDDRYTAETLGDNAVELTGEGTDVLYASINWTLQDNIEYLYLSGTDPINGTGNAVGNTITGNTGNNILSGAAGNDVLTGGGGTDTMVGGTGDDQYTVDSTDDVVTELTGEGTDTVKSNVTWTLNGDIEKLILTGTDPVNGTGNELANTITGNTGNNLLSGAAGNDVLSGGGAADTMAGGTGDDQYTVDSTDDVVTELTGEGTDLVKSSVTWTLTGEIEKLTLTGADPINGTGNELANYLTGNTGANGLGGLAGNDTIDGGAGADTMTGGTGDDRYYVDNQGDSAIELAGEGTDLLYATITWILQDNIEFLYLTGADPINGTGNASANTLTGNTGNNSLSGLDGGDTLNGGTGNDTMTGGTGDDRYYVDSLSDSAIELSGEGTDLLYTTITWTLQDNIEYLYLNGSDPINGTGNALANTITGNTGNNALYGLDGGDSLNGSTGSDTMTGGTGDDRYYVDSLSDSAIELSGEGNDTVYASVTWTLQDNIESLSLSGTDPLDGTGNALANLLTGNTVNNVLTGAAGNDSLNGGLGDDTMIGGTGDDRYYVDSLSDSAVEVSGEGSDTVYATVTYTLLDNFELLYLSGADPISGTGNNGANTLTGNTGNNALNGLAGNDVLVGGGGADTLAGGTGDDQYTVDSADDVVTEVTGEGLDLVKSSVTWTLTGDIEKLTLTGNDLINGTGNELANTITGSTSNNVLSGAAGNDVLSGGGGADTMAGGSGDDQYTVDSTDDVVNELTGEGTDLVKSSVAWTLTGDIEKLTLTGADPINGTGNDLANTITGNSGNNQLNGAAGNDALDGGAGTDTMTGGTGDDRYYVDSLDDQTIELSGEGKDMLYAAFTYTLQDNIELLYLTGTDVINGTGNASANTITGNTTNNGLFGLDGNDTLDGGLGNDTMTGGTGDDRYYLDGPGDSVIELSGEGTDQVYASFSYTLLENFETLYLSGADPVDGTGNASANTITGNTGNNGLYGLDGNDTLNGGNGSDTMIGGAGDDRYYIDGLGDSVVELSGEGTDTVYTSFTYTLLDNFESLSLSGADPISGTGNASANTITGNTGNNQLNGLDGNDSLNGGNGNDTMIGGTGDDRYYVDSLGDSVIEQSGEGNDQVRAYITYTLLENFETLCLSGAEAIDGTGNTGANTLTGNTANNALYGGLGADTLNGGTGDDRLDGGTGDDLLCGGTGNDSYYVDSTADKLREYGDGGTDVVFSQVTYTLAAYVEDLWLTGMSAINGTGNDIGNVLVGNSGNNVLTGGLGADVFTFLAHGGADTVSDFSLTQGDTLKIEGDGSTAIISQSGANVLIDLGDGNSITILNTDASDSGFLSAITWVGVG